MSVFSEKQTIQEELEICLEKFLDILVEVEKTESPSISDFSQKSLQPGGMGGGVAITFPFPQGVGLFLIAHREDLLPDWYQRPGVAGKSRLFLFANHLAQYFSAGIDEKNRSFFDSADYFAGSVAAMEEIFEKLPFSSETSILPFQLRRWDGQSTYAWLMGPFSHIEIPSQTSPLLHLASRHANILKPVRPLEGKETSLFYAPFSQEWEEIFDESQTEEKAISPPEKLPEKEETEVPAETLEQRPSVEDWESLRRELESEIHDLTVFSYSWRFRNFPTLHHQQREEQIRIRIQYAHPAHTQVWRKRVEMLWETLGKTFSQRLPEREMGEEEELLQEIIEPPEILEEVVWEYSMPHYSPEVATTTMVTPPEKMPEVPHSPVSHSPAPPRPRMSETQVLQIPVTFSVVVARQKMALRTFLQLRPGDILNFDQKIDSPMAFFVEQQQRGWGTPVEYEGRVGIQILEEEKKS
ncbi:MAG: FliM/FliN family flagellar motor C-terminal domain-containing protein [Planctomycetia bacterium]|nr:FliM/FliN family flagellar motor C-terminal domain-containing protein [Planctomycetia bacterium]